MRREWIEMETVLSGFLNCRRSPSMRREWIEIFNVPPSLCIRESPSMRREWIEITIPTHCPADFSVSLHAEGVD